MMLTTYALRLLAFFAALSGASALSYAEARAAAAAAKSGAAPAAAPAAPPPRAVATAPGVPGERYVPDAKVMRDVLATFGERISPSGRPLTQGRQLDSFTRNVDEIINAFGGAAPACPRAPAAARPPSPAAPPATTFEPAATSQVDALAFVDVDDEEDLDSDDTEILAAMDPDDVYEKASAMYGRDASIRNTYAIDNMVDMTPEEYQAEMNERKQAMQADRRSRGWETREATRAYFANMNK